MSNRRRQIPRYNNPQRHSTITQSPKPPRGNCKSSVPAWEKNFCLEVGSVPWWKVVEAKRTMFLYDRVLQWDSSAGEDAFKNAKSRYWADINGFPCDLPLPDPDLYIDDVDWNAEVDAELFLDLERGWDPVKGEEDEQVVILDALFSSGQYSGMGWGTGWGDAEEVVGTGKPENPWEDKKCGGWNDVGYGKPENSWGDKKCGGWNEEIVKTKPINPWEGRKCDGWNEDSWGRKEKTGTWDYKNNNNGFKIDTWGHKNPNNRFNHKNGENWNGKDQGREWRKRGEVQGGGDRVEDCGWRNGRGRGRTKGGFQQHSNGWGWTK